MYDNWSVRSALALLLRLSESVSSAIPLSFIDFRFAKYPPIVFKHITPSQNQFI